MQRFYTNQVYQNHHKNEAKIFDIFQEPERLLLEVNKIWNNWKLYKFPTKCRLELIGPYLFVF